MFILAHNDPGWITLGIGIGIGIGVLLISLVIGRARR
jgi:hypothetical protein